MSEAHVDSTTCPNFTEAEFTLYAYFRNITCSKGMNFSRAKFGMGMDGNPRERGAIFSEDKLISYKFLGTEFMNANFVDSQISSCSFARSYFHHARFLRSKVDKTTFLCARLEDADFNYCKLSAVNFHEAVFPDYTTFDFSSFESIANFRECKVTGSLSFDKAGFGDGGQGAQVSFDEAHIFGSISAVDARNHGLWSFNGTHFLKSTENVQTQFPGRMHDSTGHNITLEKAIFDLDEKDASNTLKKSGSRKQLF